MTTSRSSVAGTPERSRSAVDSSRPFGAHLRMSWWKPLVLIGVPPLVLVALQILLYQVVGVLEGSDDPLAPTFTPLKFLAVNLSVGATGLLAILLLMWMTGVPWRSLISSPRAFDARRLHDRQHADGGRRGRGRRPLHRFR